MNPLNTESTGCLLHVVLDLAEHAIGPLANIKSAQAVAPPSAVRMEPVIMLAAGLARKNTAPTPVLSR